PLKAGLNPAGTLGEGLGGSAPACRDAPEGTAHRTLPNARWAVEFPASPAKLHSSGSVVKESGYPAVRPASGPCVALVPATAFVNTATPHAPRLGAVI